MSAKLPEIIDQLRLDSLVPPKPPVGRGGRTQPRGDCLRFWQEGFRQGVAHSLELLGGIKNPIQDTEPPR